MPFGFYALLVDSQTFKSLKHQTGFLFFIHCIFSWFFDTSESVRYLLQLIQERSSFLYKKEKKNICNYKLSSLHHELFTFAGVEELFASANLLCGCRHIHMKSFSPIFLTWMTKIISFTSKGISWYKWRRLPMFFLFFFCEFRLRSA